MGGMPRVDSVLWGSPIGGRFEQSRGKYEFRDMPAQQPGEWVEALMDSRMHP
jgi:hypothetical protein